MRLAIDRQQCLMDEIVHLSAHSLYALRLYKIVVRVRHRTGTHQSFAVFQSDANGEIDVARAAPVRGSYSGVDPMGLFYSVVPSEDVRLGATVWATPPDPFTYDVVLLDSAGAEVDRLRHVRHWMHPRVSKTEIDNELCTGDGPFPTVVDFAGTGGGIREHRAALLASHGFATFALAFFGYKALPTDLADVDIQYFVKALDWLQTQPFVGKIGVQANSFGVVVCGLLSDRVRNVSAYCMINGLHFVDPNACIRENGEKLPCAVIPEHVEYVFKDNGLVYRPTCEQALVPAAAEFSFSAAGAGTRFRIVASTDDLSTPTLRSARAMEAKLRARGLYVELDVVPGGHLMEAPCLPHMPFVFSGFIKAFQHYGCDDAYTHGKSQERVWHRTKRFFEEALGPPTELPALQASKL